MACVDLPAFPLQLLLRRHPEWSGHPAAVVDEDKPQGKLLWVNEEARRFRILPGMRYAAGLSLARELRAGVLPASEVAAATAALCDRLRFYTPDVEPSDVEPGVFWLGTEGLGLIHTSLRRWAELIQADLLRAGFDAFVAVGFTRFGVYAAAKAGPRGPAEPLRPAGPPEPASGAAVFADEGEERRCLRGIDLDRLGIDPEVRDGLRRLGIERLGGFLDLPAEGVLRRFGAGAHRLFLAARGDISPAVRPDIPEEPLVRRVILDDPERDHARLLAVVERELRGLLEALATRDQAVSCVLLSLTPDRSIDVAEGGGLPRGWERAAPSRSAARSAPALTTRLRPARPTLDLRQIGELVRLRLESLVLSSGVVDLRVEVEGVSAPAEQGRLFRESPHRDRRAGSRALARIRAEFGEEAVARCRLREAHLPEDRFSWEPLEELPDPHPRAVRLPPLVRRILAAPVPCAAPRGCGPTTDARGDRDGRSAGAGPGGGRDGDGPRWCGPYVVSGGWWRSAFHREYYFAHAVGAGTSWVFFDALHRRWFRQGAVE